MVRLPYFFHSGARPHILRLLLAFLFLPVALQGQTTWRGTVSSVWTNAANWNAGVPDSTVTAIIRPGTFDPTVPVTGAYVASMDLDLQNNGVLNFANGAILTVHGVFNLRTGSTINLGGGHLVLKGGVILHNVGTFNADSGTIEMSGASWTNNASGPKAVNGVYRGRSISGTGSSRVRPGWFQPNSGRKFLTA